MDITKTTKSSSFDLYILFILLGFVSGLPFCLLTTTLQVWFTTLNVNDVIISSLTLLTLPYSLKPLWGIFADYSRGVRWLDYHNFYSATVFGVALCLFAAGNVSPTLHPKSFVSIMCLLAVFSSGLDTIVDGLRVTIVPRDDQAAISAYFVAAYRVAMLVSGAGVLMLAKYGFDKIYLAMAVLTLAVGFLSSCMLQFYTTKADNYQSPASNSIETITSVLSWVSKKEIIYLMLFGVLFKSHEACVQSLLPVYLLKEFAMSTELFAIIGKTVGLFVTLLGGICAGYCLKNWHEDFCIQGIVLLQMLASLMFFAAQYVPASEIKALSAVGANAWLAMDIKLNLLAVIGAIIMENFANGLATTFCVVIFMRNCSREHAATQYAIITAFCNSARALIGPIAGKLKILGGWDMYFTASILVLLPLIILMQSELFDGIFAEEDVDYALR